MDEEEYNKYMVEIFLEENYTTKPDIDNPCKLYWKNDVIDAILKYNELNKHN